MARSKRLRHVQISQENTIVQNKVNQPNSDDETQPPDSFLDGTERHEDEIENEVYDDVQIIGTFKFLIIYKILYMFE